MELALIDFADQMVFSNQEGTLDKPLYDRLRSHLTEEQIMEIALVSAILVGAAKLGFTLGPRDREVTCEIGRLKALAA